jgi:hypothetical protein
VLPSTPTFAIPKKNGTIRVVTDFRKLNLLLTHRMSPISYSNNWGSSDDPFNGRLYLCHRIGLSYRLICHQPRCWCSKAMYNCIPMAKYKWTLTHGYWDYLFPDVFKNSCLILSKIWNMLRLTCYLDDLLILTNRSFKDHLLKLEMFLARVSTLNHWYESECILFPNLSSL